MPPVSGQAGAALRGVATLMAYLFGSTGHVIDCGTGVPMASTWSVFTRATVPAGVAAAVALALRTDAGSLNFQLYVFTNPADTMELDSSSGGCGYAHGLTGGSEHTLVGTYDGTSLRLYVDADATPKAQGLATPPQPAGAHFLIGADATTGTTSWNAKIYEVGYWNGTVLTGAEAAAIHAGTPPAVQAPFYWPLVSDAVALYGGQNGTVTGAAVVAHSGSNLYSGTPPETSIRTIHYHGA